MQTTAKWTTENACLAPGGDLQVAPDWGHSTQFSSNPFKPLSAIGYGDVAALTKPPKIACPG